MSNILLASQNRTDEGTLSGGSWLASLPLTNLQNRQVQKVARTTDAAKASTKFVIDLGQARNIGVIALVVHNISVTGKVRVTGDTSPTFASPIYQSAWIDAWPTGIIPQSQLEFEDDNFWLGTLSQNARAGYQSPFIHVPPSGQILRYWSIEIDDTGNPDGYIQIGRLFMSPAWTPNVNYEYGADLVYTDPTPIETSLSGAEYFDVRSRVREFTFTLGGLNNSEAYDYALQMQRLCGTNGEVLQIPDISDTSRLPIRAFVGRLSSLNPLTNITEGRFKIQIKLRELI